MEPRDYLTNKVTMTELIYDLKELKSNYGVIGIKQSFEDEGVILDDVITMRRITELAGLELYIKIGGCEANSDIQTCENLGVDAIIAPMIETEFAMQKYMEATQDSKMKLYFVCESKTAGLNINEILKKSENKLTGVVIGRSDLCKSFGMNKSEVNSDAMAAVIRNILREIKEFGLSTTMGGNISIKSLDLILDLYNKKLLDKIETRNVVINLNNPIFHSILKETIRKSLDFEIKWLKYKSQNYLKTGNSYSLRASALENRK